MRTEQQLGYIVNVSKHKICNVIGIKYIIQWQEDMKYVNECINNFINNQKYIIMDKTNLENRKKNMKIKFWQKKNNFYDKNYITYKNFVLNINFWRKQKIKMINSIDLFLVNNIYNNIFNNQNIDIVIDNKPNNNIYSKWNKLINEY